MHLEFKFAGVMTWSSGADLEATKRGSHRLRQAGRSCTLSVLLGRNPSINLCLGWEQRHSESSAARASWRLSKGCRCRARPLKKDAAQGRFDSFATSPVNDRTMRVAVIDCVFRTAVVSPKLTLSKSF